MSFYEDRFRNHPVHEILPSTKKRLESFISATKDSDAIEHLTRLLEITTYAQSVMSNIAHIFVSEGTLNNLNKILSNINGDLNTYETNQDINLLITANGKADNLLNHLKQLTQLDQPSDLQNLSESLSEYHRSIDGILTNINKQKKEFEGQINDSSSRLDQFNSTLDQYNQTIESQKGRLDSAITEFQAQFSEAEDRRRISFEDQMKAHKEEFQEYSKSKTDEINSFIGEKQQEVIQAITTYSEKTQENITDLKETADALYQEHENKAKDTIQFLEEKRDEAAKLLNVISNVGVTGNYKEIANSERKTANLLRLFAIIFMIAGIFVIAQVVFNISKVGFDWKLLLSRIGVTIVILIPAFYLVKESASHRRNEVRNRKMELELASINPFLELLPEEKRNELKAKLTENFFGQPESILDQKEYVTATSVFELLEKVLLNLTKRFRL